MTEKKWFLVDAKDKVVGRLATQIATVLIGKNKRTYTPGTDNGDFVVVINSDSLVFTGKKLQHKFYYKNTGYPGGLRSKNCLLYTSPSPRDAIPSRMPSSA